MIFRLLAEQGLWDERPIVEAIASRRFALVALRAPLEARLADVEWTAAVRDAIRGAYVPVGQAAGYWFYRPSGSVAAIDEGSLPGAEDWHSSTPFRGR